MSILDAILSADSRQDASAALAGTTSTAEIIYGAGEVIAINASGDINIKFGASGMTAAAATNFRIPGGVVATYVFGNGSDRIRLFNPGATSVTYYIQVLSTN